MLILFTEINMSFHKTLLLNNLHHLAESSQQRIAQYVRWQNAQLSLLGELLLKEGFSYYGKKADLKTLKSTYYKKPYFEDSTLQFNISHSGRIVVAAFTEKHPVIGIDIEQINDLSINDFVSQMTPIERDRILASHEPQTEFYRYWTQKEAVLKAHGYGLSIPLKSFEIKCDQTNIEGELFFVSEVFLKLGYICHVAALDKIHKPKILKVPTQKFLW